MVPLDEERYRPSQTGVFRRSIPSFLVPPALNVEIKAYLNPNDINRDERFVEKQRLVACSLTSIGADIQILRDKETDVEEVLKYNLVELLTEAAMLQAHLYFEILQTRKGFIIRAVKNVKVKELLEGRETIELI